MQTLTKQVQQLQQEAKKGREGESRSSRTEHEGTIGAQCSSPNEAAKSWHEQTDEIVESRTEHGREPSPSSSRPQQGLARPRTDGTGEYKSQERRPRISASTAARPEHKKRPRALDPKMQKTPRRRPRALCHQQPKTTCGHWYPQERTRRRGKCYTLGMSDPAQPERTSQSTLQNGRKEWASSARKFSIPRYSRPSLAQNSAESGCRLTLSLQRR